MNATTSTQSSNGDAIPSAVYNSLPSLLAKACSFHGEWYQRDVYLTGLLGVLSACLPNVRFQYDGIYYSPHLMLFVIARAGAGKGALTDALRACESIVQAKQEQTRRERAEWETRRRAYEKDKDGDLPDPGPRPPEYLLSIGADFNVPALYQALMGNPEGVLVASTEADVFSNANKRRDLGGVDSLLRVAFHHESTGKSTKGEGYVHIAEPRIALVMAGTPGQYQPIVQNVENGLHSRIGVYSFSPPLEYVSRYGRGCDGERSRFRRDLQERVKAIYDTLQGRDGVLHVDLPENLWSEIDTVLSGLHATLFGAEEKAFTGFAANINRGFVITFRIASILAVYRAHERGVNLSVVSSITLTGDDVEAAISLAQAYIIGAISQAISNLSVAGQPVNLIAKLRFVGMTKQRYWEALPEGEFSTQQALEIAETLSIPPRSAERYLQVGVETGVIIKKGRGLYEKGSVADWRNGGMEGVSNATARLTSLIETIRQTGPEALSGLSMLAEDASGRMSLAEGVCAEETPAGVSAISAIPPVRDENNGVLRLASSRWGDTQSAWLVEVEGGADTLALVDWNALSALVAEVEARGVEVAVTTVGERRQILFSSSLSEAAQKRIVQFAPALHALLNAWGDDVGWTIVYELCNVPKTPFKLRAGHQITDLKRFRDSLLQDALSGPHSPRALGVRADVEALAKVRDRTMRAA